MTPLTSIFGRWLRTCIRRVDNWLGVRHRYELYPQMGSLGFHYQYKHLGYVLNLHPSMVC